MEIERKYLVASLPENLDSYPHVEIEQCYLCTSPTVRVRRMGDVHILTVKENLSKGREGEAIHNREEEFLLSAESYKRLKAKCEGRPVLKTRYKILLNGGLIAELDLFHGVHQGLQLVEVEFPDTAASDAFTPPDWFGEEVSSDCRYRNSWLAFNV